MSSALELLNALVIEEERMTARLLMREKHPRDIVLAMCDLGGACHELMKAGAALHMLASYEADLRCTVQRYNCRAQVQRRWLADLWVQQATQMAPRTFIQYPWYKRGSVTWSVSVLCWQGPISEEDVMLM
ncbi:MAG: hypothetical protein E6R03_01465 [Hyphomicrobiaceae bacterium]|nr:MAG: hypothetical protein E6R03_01465 [Hyphomicrobiaceae bacterium]